MRMAIRTTNEAHANLNNFQIYVKGSERFRNKCYVTCLLLYTNRAFVGKGLYKHLFLKNQAIVFGLIFVS